MILRSQNNYIYISFNLSKFILKSPAMIIIFLQLCSNNDTMEDNSFRLSFDVRGGLYMFPIVMLLERLPPFIWTIKPSQCSYMFSFNLTFNLYIIFQFIMCSFYIKCINFVSMCS